MRSLVVLSDAMEAVVTQFPWFGNERQGAVQYAKKYRLIRVCVLLLCSQHRADKIPRQFELKFATIIFSNFRCQNN